MTTPTTANAPAKAATAALSAAQRTNMVDSQIRPSDISDRRIIRAMGAVDRQLFVPETARAVAYMDKPITLSKAPVPRQMVEPRLLAKLIQMANIPDGGSVLEVGSATGYGVAVLVAMGCKAYGVEDNTELAAAANVSLKAAGVTGADVLAGSLKAGRPNDGPYDAIILPGSIPEAPSSLFDQVKAGGCIVAILGTGPDAKATAWVRTGMTFAAREDFSCTAAPLSAFKAQKAFAL